ncbi:hypothetical protein KGO5_04854 [Sinorhizobium sp. KGO-5]|uniref:hypothetical protein n=1 Tax=Sinorhizobium sp. KGO-5 TaxID=1470810 RepID=UPI00294A1291|nr:hypothetical protein KGO5_04854 [Sinorhizobium sp. KGO-5]
MPRTGGVYSPPAGTKGVSNTTIQSVPYNALVDDLSADANAARPVTAGGTGATSASAARTNLGLAIGTNVQAYDAGLQSIAALATAADRMIYTTAADAYATTALTPFARTILGDADAAAALTTLGVSAFAKAILDDTDAATARTTLGVAIGADVQAYDAGLQSISGLTTAADRTVYTTASDVYATTALTPFARTILDDTSAAAVKTTLGLAAVASSGSASDLSSGTISDARLPGSMAGKNFSSGISFANAVAAGSTDLSKHIQLYSGYGFTITGSTLNYTVPANSSHVWNVNGTEVGRLNSSGLTLATPLALAEGGTGSTDAATARGNLGANSASNLTTGTVPNARIAGAYDGITTLGQTGTHTITTPGEAIRIVGPASTDDPYVSFYKGATRQAYIQHTDGTGVNQGLRIYNDTATGGDTALTLKNSGGVDSLEFQVNGAEHVVYHSGNLSSADLNSIYGYTPANSAKQIIAGNGLTGGGTLAADRTLTLGTPGDITNSTTNSVTSTSHTHALGFTAAEVYVGTGANDTSFPLGHIVALGNDANIARNASGTPTLHNSINRYYVPSTHPSAGAALAGTWRSRGVVNGNGEYNIMQRVA